MSKGNHLNKVLPEIYIYLNFCHKGDDMTFPAQMHIFVWKMLLYEHFNNNGSLTFLL